MSCNVQKQHQHGSHNNHGNDPHNHGNDPTAMATTHSLITLQMQHAYKHCTYLQSVEVGEVGKEGKFVITKVVVSREGDLLVHHVQAIVVGITTSSPVEQRLRRWTVQYQ